MSGPGASDFMFLRLEAEDYTHRGEVPKLGSGRMMVMHWNGGSASWVSPPCRRYFTLRLVAQRRDRAATTDDYAAVTSRSDNRIRFQSAMCPGRMYLVAPVIDHDGNF
jgi:hypothetical protein